MIYNMFVDDERYPANDGKQWVIVRNKTQFIAAVEFHDYTLPTYVSFDHDLGENEETGYDIAKWIVECHMDGDIVMPQDFHFYVHSQNPIGKRNIEAYLNNYLKERDK